MCQACVGNVFGWIAGLRPGLTRRASYMTHGMHVDGLGKLANKL
jgi:hypothetical protein